MANSEAPEIAPSFALIARLWESATRPRLARRQGARIRCVSGSGALLARAERQQAAAAEMDETEQRCDERAAVLLTDGEAAVLLTDGVFEALIRLAVKRRQQ